MKNPNSNISPFELISENLLLPKSSIKSKTSCCNFLFDNLNIFDTYFSKNTIVSDIPYLCMSISLLVKDIIPL